MIFHLCEILKSELCAQTTHIKSDKYMIYHATIYANQMSDCIGLQNLACAVSGLQNQNQTTAVVGMPSKKLDLRPHARNEKKIAIDK